MVPTPSGKPEKFGEHEGKNQGILSRLEKLGNFTQNA